MQILKSIFLIVIGFAEKLFRQLEVSNEKYEVRVIMMNVISRLVGVHEVRKPLNIE